MRALYYDPVFPFPCSDFEDVRIWIKQKSVGGSMRLSEAALQSSGYPPCDPGLSMDIVFEWASVGKVTLPKRLWGCQNEIVMQQISVLHVFCFISHFLLLQLVNKPETNNPFHDNDVAMCAVKALKLLKDARVAGFGALSGCKIEGMVLWLQQEWEETRQLVHQLVRKIFHSVVERASGCSMADATPMSALTPPINASNLFFGVIGAFLPGVRLLDCHQSPNPAVRMRYIEEGIRAQQPTMLINELLDLGRFNACQNAAKCVLRRIKAAVASPLEALLQRQPELSPADFHPGNPDFDGLVDALGQILSPAAARPATGGAAVSGTAENPDGDLDQQEDSRLLTYGSPPGGNRGSLSSDLIDFLDVQTARRTGFPKANRLVLEGVPSGDFQGAAVHGGQVGTPQGQAVSIEATGASASASAAAAAAVSGGDDGQHEEIIMKPQAGAHPHQTTRQQGGSEENPGSAGAPLEASGSNFTPSHGPVPALMPAGAGNDSNFWTTGLPRPSPWLMAIMLSNGADPGPAGSLLGDLVPGATELESIEQASAAAALSGTSGQSGG